jgi:hypothetical protein
MTQLFSFRLVVASVGFAMLSATMGLLASAQPDGRPISDNSLGAVHGADQQYQSTSSYSCESQGVAVAKTVSNNNSVVGASQCDGNNNDTPCAYCASSGTGTTGNNPNGVQSGTGQYQDTTSCGQASQGTCGLNPAPPVGPPSPGCLNPQPIFNRDGSGPLNCSDLGLVLNQPNNPGTGD